MFRAQLVPSAANTSLVVVQWRDEGGFSRWGVHVWRISSASSIPADWRATQWDLIYAIDPHETSVAIGPPESQVVEDSDNRLTQVLDIGDLTGDGLRDLVVQGWNGGTGGCGVSRVLENGSEALREIFRRDDCELLLEASRGNLKLTDAIYPKGCSQAHGCGRLTTLLHWDGSSWTQVARHREVY
jgi:hypothetical protein